MSAVRWQGAGVWPLHSFSIGELVPSDRAFGAVETGPSSCSEARTRMCFAYCNQGMGCVLQFVAIKGFQPPCGRLLQQPASHCRKQNPLAACTVAAMPCVSQAQGLAVCQTDCTFSATFRWEKTGLVTICVPTKHTLSLALTSVPHGTEQTTTSTLGCDHMGCSTPPSAPCATHAQLL